MKRNKPKRLIVDISDKFHNELKRRALIKECTLREYIINAIEFYQNDQENHKPEFQK